MASPSPGSSAFSTHGSQRAQFRSAGNSTRIARVLLTTEPPSIDANEITDKGYLNQQAVLARRANLVERLYSATADPDVVVLSGTTTRTSLQRCPVNDDAEPKPKAEKPVLSALKFLRV